MNIEKNRRRFCLIDAFSEARYCITVWDALMNTVYADVGHPSGDGSRDGVDSVPPVFFAAKSDGK
jgi:hypothetical protein